MLLTMAMLVTGMVMPAFAAEADADVVIIGAGGVIADVVVVSNNETPNFAAKALESIPAAIKAANSATVDAVSGATKTSNRIMNAVALCLEAAAAELNINWE